MAMIDRASSKDRTPPAYLMHGGNRIPFAHLEKSRAGHVTGTGDAASSWTRGSS